MGVQFLGWEDSLDEDMTIHSSIPAWKIPFSRSWSLAGYSTWGHKELDTTEHLSTHTHL